MKRYKRAVADLPTGVGVNKVKDGAGLESWRVRLGSKFTGGKIITKHFTNLDDVRHWIHGDAQKEKANPGSIIALKEVAGESAFRLTAKQIAEADAAFKRLKKYSLTEAVTYYLKHANPAGGIKTFGEIVPEFITSRKRIGCKPKTMIQYESYLRIISAEWAKTTDSEKACRRSAGTTSLISSTRPRPSKTP